MKPKNLRYPFPWQERRPLLVGQVFFIPEYYQDHDAAFLPPWEEIFGNTNPILLEYCSGNGSWIIEKARAHPDQNFIAVEKKFERVQKIWSKMSNGGLKNLLIIAGEALVASRCYFKTASIDAICVHFPDPWPKEKHAKNRLFQEPFVSELARIAKKGATLRAVTDDADYAGQILSAVVQSPSFTTAFPEPFYITDFPGYGTSYFEELWRSQGREIRYLEFLCQ